MRTSHMKIAEPTLGSYVRGDRNRRHPYGFYELYGFPLLVRCSAMSRGSGCEDSVRIAVEFRFVTAKLKIHANPDAVLDWSVVCGFDEAIRNIARTYPHDYVKPHEVLIDGNGRQLDQ